MCSSFDRLFTPPPFSPRQNLSPALDTVESHPLKTLERIQADPYRGRRLVNVTVGQWRDRVGDYRIRYDIKGQVVVLHVVRHRKEVYR